MLNPSKYNFTELDNAINSTLTGNSKKVKKYLLRFYAENTRLESCSIAADIRFSKKESFKTSKDEMDTKLYFKDSFDNLYDYLKSYDYNPSFMSNILKKNQA